MTDLNILLKVLSSAGVNIDPATEQTLASVLAKLDVSLSSRASEATLAQALVKLGDIFGAVDGLELTSENIAINAESIDLNTDEVEAILRTIRDNLGLTTDAEALANGTIIAIAKRLRTLLAAGLPTALYLDRLKASDRYTGEEYLEDQPGAGGVLDFAFSVAPDLVFVRSVGAVSRATFNTVAPTAAKGVYCGDDEATPIVMSGQTALKVFAPVGAAVSVWGFRYT